MSTRASSARAAKPAAAAAHADDDDGEEPDAGGAVGTTPLDGLNVAPFLYKLRALVDEASTNDIVSWSASGLSFVVHSIPRFEQEVLPRSFKHSNFASFVRQLNNYGFRKCHTDRFEFAVEGFQRDKPELLKTLKRHDAQRQSKKSATTSREVSQGLVELGAYGTQSDVEQLKRDRYLLLKEVMRLRTEQSATSDELQRVSARLQQTENVQQQILQFLQQHVSPTLLDANSHILNTRKRRHLLLPSPNTDTDTAAVGELRLPSPGRLHLQELSDDAYQQIARPTDRSASAAQPPAASAPSQLTLQAPIPALPPNDDLLWDDEAVNALLAAPGSDDLEPLEVEGVDDLMQLTSALDVSGPSTSDRAHAGSSYAFRAATM